MAASLSKYAGYACVVIGISVGGYVAGNWLYVNNNVVRADSISDAISFGSSFFGNSNRYTERFEKELWKKDWTHGYKMSEAQGGWECAKLVGTLGLRAAAIDKIVCLEIWIPEHDKQFFKHLRNAFNMHGYMSIELAVQVAAKNGYIVYDTELMTVNSILTYNKQLRVRFKRM